MSESLKLPLLSEAELQPSSQHSRDALHSHSHSVALDASAPAASAAASSGLLGHFKLLFPDFRTRLLFLLCLVAAVVLSIVWLVYTVQSKWLYSIHHPQQFVSYERMGSLPAFFGHAITYFDDLMPTEAVLLRFVTTKFQFNNAAQRFLNGYIQCAPGLMFYPLTLCQPADAQGKPFLAPVDGEMDGASALAMQSTLEDASQWPLQFAGSTDALCLTSFVFLNATRMPVFVSLSQMLFALVPLSLQQLLAMEEHMAVGANIPSDPRMWSLVNSLTSPTVMQYQQRHLVRLTATKTVHTNGEHEWAYAYNSGKDLALLDVDLQSYADSMLNVTATTDPALHAQVLALLPGAAVGQWNHSEIKLLLSDVCFTPSSYTVQVVRETSTYGAISFLSDLGGFANLVSIVMLALFPLAVSVVRPRSFVILWLSDKWTARSKRKEAAAHAEAQAGLRRGHVGLEAIN